MQVVGFNFTKIRAEKLEDFNSPFSLNTNIEFKDLTSEKTTLLKEGQTVKISFSYSLSYFKNEENKKENQMGEILLEGNLIFTSTKEESKEIEKFWKKRKLPDAIKIPVFNFILRKCTPKAIALQEDISLPPHIPFPRITAEQKKE